jgi:hypothetical protein
MGQKKQRGRGQGARGKIKITSFPSAPCSLLPTFQTLHLKFKVNALLICIHDFTLSSTVSL